MKSEDPAVSTEPSWAGASALPLLDVVDLTVELGGGRPVDGVTLQAHAGRTLGLVGESGSGKSMTALALMRLLPPGASIVAGSARFDGVDLLSLDERALRALRGARIAMIFQEPMTALNPVMKVGAQIAEGLRAHRPVPKKEAWAAAVDMLTKVGVAAPAERAHAYPHELSGGMRQRVLIAMALVCGPRLLLADEPTTALDVTVQAQILELLASERRRLGMGVLLVTHDLGVVAQTCDDVCVMYAGQIVESAPVDELFARPRHPYTLGLLRSVPRVGGALHAIPGAVPPLRARPTGCRFRDRCERAQDKCAEAPPLVAIGPTRARCWFPVEGVA